MEFNLLFTLFNQILFRQEQAFLNHSKQFYLQPFDTRPDAYLKEEQFEGIL